MTVVLLAGPPAVGHNTVAELIGARRPRSALVDGDVVRDMVLSPPSPLGSGEEWERQYALAIRNCCGLARSFDANQMLVLLLDVVEPEVLPLFRQELRGVSRLAVILLTARIDVLLERDRARDPEPPGPGLEVWHGRIRFLHAKLEASRSAYDHCLDNSDLTPEQTADAVERVIESS